MNWTIFPGLKTKEDAKIRVCDLQMGDSFELFGINQVVVKKTDGQIIYRLLSHGNDVNIKNYFGSKSQKLVIRKAQI